MNLHDQKVIKAYNRGVDSYMTKLIELTRLMIAVRSISHLQVTVTTSVAAA
jgi:hypothetical protein